jgi:hypothetical protein
LPGWVGLLNDRAYRRVFVFGRGEQTWVPKLGDTDQVPCQTLTTKSKVHPIPDDPERRPLLAPKPKTPYRSRPAPPIARYSSRFPSPDVCADPNTEDRTEKSPSIKVIMRAPAVRRMLVSYAFMAFVTVSVNAVFVLWLYVPVDAGGLGFNVSA